MTKIDKSSKQSIDNRSYELSDFIIQNQIGEGGFGKVYIVKLKESGEIFAAKISTNKIEDSSNQLLHDISREVNIISKLDHPSVLKFIFYSFYNFKNKPKPVIITEYAPNGTLGDLIKTEMISHTNIYWDDTHKLIIIYGIAAAMSYLHSHNIIHRDLKPDNVLLDKYMHPKIGDFGFSKVNHQNVESLTLESTVQLKGTPIYMAPEVWLKHEYSTMGDVYAFGMIVYEMMTLDRPFKDFNLFQLYQFILSGGQPQFKIQIPDSYKNLIKMCWSKEPSNRPSFDQIVKMLKSDKGFITEKVDEKEFKNYIQYVDTYESSFDKTKNIFYAEFHKNLKKIIIKKDAFDHINIFENPSLKDEIIPLREFNTYDIECKKLINDAEQDAEKQFIVGCSFIEGRDSFPFSTKYGLKYIKKSYKNGCIESLKYYIKMLIKGKLIPRNLDKASKLIEDYFKNDPGEYSYFVGLMKSKEDKHVEAFKSFCKSAQNDSPEGLYKLAKYLYVNANNDDNEQKEEALKFLHMAGDEGCVKAYRIYGLYMIHYNSDLREEGKKYLKLAADKGDAVASYFYSAILHNDGNQDDLLESADYMKMAANAGNVDAMREYNKRYPYNKDDPVSVNNYVRFCKKACDKGDFYSMYLYGLLLKKGEVVKNDYRLANRLFEIADKNGIGEAKIELGIKIYF